MKTTADFLDDLQKHFGVTSDYAVAGKMGMHRQHISHYRNLKGAFDDEMCVRVAEILEVKPAFVMACMHYQRAKNPKVRDAWQYLGGLAAALAFFAVLPFGFGMDNLTGNFFGNVDFIALAGFTTDSLYIMSNELWGIFSAFWYLFAADVTADRWFETKRQMV